MDKIRINQLKSLLDTTINNDNNSKQAEIWFARELKKKLRYAR